MDERQIVAYEIRVKALTEATERDQIVWKKQNPTTYYYESTPNETTYITSIQRLPNDEFVLLIYEKESNEMFIDINSSYIGQTLFGHMLANAVAMLFKTIENVISQRSIDVFDAIVNNIRNR